MLRTADYRESQNLPPQEFAIHGNKQALRNGFLKQQLLKEGRYEEAAQICLLVFYMGGGQGVSNEVGPAEVMHEIGWHDGVVDIVAGASGGAVVATHVATGNLAAKEILKRNCDNSFVSPRNFRRGGLVGFGELLQTFREFPVDQKRLADSKAKVVVYTTNTHEDPPVFVGHELSDVTTHPDTEIKLHASCLIPLVGDVKYVEINGEKHVDGATMGLPLDALKAFAPTDIIIVGAFPMKRSWAWQLAGNVAERASRSVIARKNSLRRVAFGALNAQAKSVQEALLLNGDGSGINLAVISPTTSAVGILTTEWRKVDHAMKESYSAAKRLFRQIGQEVGVQYAQVA